MSTLDNKTVSLHSRALVYSKLALKPPVNLLIPNMTSNYGTKCQTQMKKMKFEAKPNAKSVNRLYGGAITKPLVSIDGRKSPTSK